MLYIITYNNTKLNNGKVYTSIKSAAEAATLICATYGYMPMIEDYIIPTREEIETMLKNKKWGKSDYAYAIKGMDHWNSKGRDYDLFKKDEIVNEFFRLAETRFHLIASYNTFK